MKKFLSDKYWRGQLKVKESLDIDGWMVEGGDKTPEESKRRLSLVVGTR